MRIAVDAMGGDRQPAAPIRGALDALAARPDLEVALVGQPEVIRAHSADAPAGLGERLSVVAASEVIGAGESPTRAVRDKRDSSIVVGLRLCAGGAAAAFVSAGNTGALVAGGVLLCGHIAGVHRPCMPAVLPSVDGRGSVLLDVGATPTADARNLCDFALMGSLYAERARGVGRPRVALLNVGTEEAKGTRASQEAFAQLQAGPLDFVGNIEGRDLFAGRADVIVTDGFVGNVVIKAVEGLGIGISQVLGRELRHSGFLTLVGAALAARTLRGLRKRMDYAEYGGAPLLGVNGVCVKCHGSSDARAMRNGVLAAARIVQGEVVSAIAAGVAEGGAALAGRPRGEGADA